MRMRWTSQGTSACSALQPVGLGGSQPARQVLDIGIGQVVGTAWRP
jgi:hypothetical protein